MEWRDGLGKALQDERPDQSTSNRPISDLVASFSADVAVRVTLPHKATILVSVLFSLQEHHGHLAAPTQNPFSVFCH